VAGWWFGPFQFCCEQAPDLADGQRDEAGASGRRCVGPGWRGRLGIGAVPQLGGGDGADRQGGHDQDDVPQDRGVEPDLALVQAEAAFSQLEALLNGPSQPGCPDQAGLGRGLPSGT
jgi:hypothetical protein